MKQGGPNYAIDFEMKDLILDTSDEVFESNPHRGELQTPMMWSDESSSESSTSLKPLNLSNQSLSHTNSVQPSKSVPDSTTLGVKEKSSHESLEQTNVQVKSVQSYLNSTFNNRYCHKSDWQKFLQQSWGCTGNGWGVVVRSVERKSGNASMFYY